MRTALSLRAALGKRTCAFPPHAVRCARVRVPARRDAINSPIVRAKALESTLLSLGPECVRLYIDGPL